MLATRVVLCSPEREWGKKFYSSHEGGGLGLGAKRFHLSPVMWSLRVNEVVNHCG